MSRNFGPNPFSYVTKGMAQEGNLLNIIKACRGTSSRRWTVADCMKGTVAQTRPPHLLATCHQLRIKSTSQGAQSECPIEWIWVVTASLSMPGAEGLWPSISLSSCGRIWVCGVLEKATSICTGFIYCDKIQRTKGFCGKRRRSGNCSACGENTRLLTTV